MSNNYDHSVFINAPFDETYQGFLNAITFTIAYCGFFPRCAKEAYDSGEIRIRKINKIIKECKYGIHDISCTGLNKNSLPRFNMPFELGLFIGARYFGSKPDNKKACLILDKTPYRYQQFISDISGQDISYHNESKQTLIKLIRDWLAHYTKRNLAGGRTVQKDYDRFISDLPEMCAFHNRTPDELTYVEFRKLAIAWINELFNLR
jgi:hypothetical protein